MAWFAGVERSVINWFPTIHSDKCVQCGLCMNCGKKVYSWGSDHQPHVVAPNECVVGCSTCANLCPGKAIEFPDLTELRATYKKHKIWSHVRKQMLAEGKITAQEKERDKSIEGEI